MNRRNHRTVGLVLVALLLVGTLAVTGEVRSQETDDGSPYRELQIFTDVLAIVRRSYVEEVPMKDLIYGAINGMLAALDPHSSFMPPEVYKEMKIDTSGEFGGLGIEISVRDGALTIVAPIEDTPAARAGLQSGDLILKIDGQTTREMDVSQAVKLMRGPKGSKITITVLREGFEKPQDFALVRELIRIRSVKSKTLEDGYAHVRLVQFQERTVEDLQSELNRLRGENGGELRGVILDLRNNPGGLLDQAVKVSDLFLSSGLIVYTEGREEGSQMRFSAHLDGTEPPYPMVVLINGGSASASEIVAGALHDNGRAVILGTQSFGKGSVQTIIPLSDDSGVRLTTARYFTPNGTSIQARGITPDILVKQGEIKEVADGTHFREKDLKRHFETPGKAADRPEIQPTSKFKLNPESAADYQLMRALDLLKGWHLLKGFQTHAG